MNIKSLLSQAGTKIARATGRTGLKIKKHSPEILFVAGIGTFVGTVILACHETLSAEEIIDHHNKQMEDIEKAKQIAEEFPEQYEYNNDIYERDKKIAMLKTVGRFVKLYAPSIALGGISITCLLTSRNILNKRYLGAVAAYNSLSTIFDTYRERVKNELGEEMDRHFRYNTVTSLENDGAPTKDPETGKKVQNKKIVESTKSSDIDISDVARVFDERNKNWEKEYQFNLTFLKGIQNYMNDILRTRGHVFLNEVYDALGFDMTSQGAVVGWLRDSETGDGFIDFGIFNRSNERGVRLLDGHENAFLLDFNHDGMIYDKI